MERISASHGKRALIRVIGYAMFISGNSFILREPGFLLPDGIIAASGFAYAIPYISQGACLLAIGFVAISGRGVTRRRLVFLATATIAVGTFCAIAGDESFLGLDASRLALAIFGVYAAFSFVSWVSCLVAMDKNEAWMFVISSAVLASLLFFGCVAILELYPNSAFILFLSMSSISIFIQVRDLDVSKEIEKCGDDNANKSNPVQFIKQEAFAVLALGVLGLVASVFHSSVSRVPIIATCTIEMVALVCAGFVLLLAVFVVGAKLDLEKIFLAAFPTVALLLMLFPFSSGHARLIIMGVSIALYNVGLIFLLMIAFEIGQRSQSLLLAKGCYGIFAGVVNVIRPLGYLIPSLTLGEGGMAEDALLALGCSLLLSLCLLPKRKGKPVGVVKGIKDVEEACENVRDCYGLTARETEILRLIMQGRDVPGIAKQLVISQNTARTHCKRMYKKLSVHSRQECVDLVMRELANH